MNARNDVKRLFHPNMKRALATARRRLAVWVDVRVARWLERCATNLEAAQDLFPGRSTAGASGMGRDPSRLIPTPG